MSFWSRLFSLNVQARKFLLASSKQKFRRALIESLEVRTVMTADPPGDDLLHAMQLTLNSGATVQVSETIGNGDYSWADVDLYRVNLTSGSQLTADIDTNSSMGMFMPLNTYLRVFNASGTQVAFNDDEGSVGGTYLNDSKVIFSPTAAGVYYVGVSSSGNGNYNPNVAGTGSNFTTGAYLLKLSLVGGSSVNQSPQAQPDTYQVLANKRFESRTSVLANDTDPDGNMIVPLVQAGPSHGELNWINDAGQFRYVPTTGYVGSDTFTYLVSDGKLVSSTVTVTLNVTTTAPDSQTGSSPLYTNPPIVVNSSGDPQYLDSNVVTLRKALALADATPGLDLITFNLAPQDRQLFVSQTQPLTIQSDVAIEGPTDGGQLRITLARYATNGRLFNVQTGVNATISDVMIDSGYLLTGNGGAISNSGKLTLDRVTVANSQAVAGDGGGIFNAAGAHLRMRNSTVSGNTATAQGGGIHNLGSLVMSNVTVANNTATAAAGISASGGATLFNSLIVGNQGSANVSGTFVSNGYNILGNIGTATGFQPSDQLGVVNAKIGPLQDNGGSGWTHQLLIGSPAIDAGQNMAAGQYDNRHARRVLDGPDPTNAQDTVATADIGAFEFGTLFVTSIEDRIDASLLGDGRVDADPNAPGDQVSLRGAFQEFGSITNFTNYGSQAVRFESVITSTPTTFSNRLSIRGSNDDVSLSGDLDVYGKLRLENLGITGAYAPLTGPLIGSYLQDRIIDVGPGSELEVSRSAFTEGATTGNGAILRNDGGTVRLIDSTINTNTYLQAGIPIAQKGGGIFTRNGSLTLTHSQITGNTAFFDHSAMLGGGIYIESGDVIINDRSVLNGNTALEAGGGIYLESGTLLVTDESVVQASRITAAAGGAGVGIYNKHGTVSIRGQSQVVSNDLVQRGGHRDGVGIFNLGTVTISENSKIANNGELLLNATGVGIFNAGNLSITDSDVSGNRGWGAAGIYNSRQGVLQLNNSRLVGNISQIDQAGGIHNAGGVVTVLNSKILYNAIDKMGVGAGIHNNNGTVTVIGSDISNNSTMGFGGGIYNFDLDAKLTVVNSTVNGNTANLAGGGIYNQFGTVSIQNSSITDNDTHIDNVGGGGIYHRGENMYLLQEQSSAVTLEAYVNSTQTIVFVNDTQLFESMTLPIPILIDNEHMVIKSIDPIKSALTVERSSGTSHSVTAPVRLYIDDKQTQVTLADTTALLNYTLPLDVIVQSFDPQHPERTYKEEVMTITSIQGKIVTVQRGRNGTAVAEHPYPFQAWAVSGGLTIAGSTISGNQSSLVPGSGISSFVHPYAPMTVIENSTIAGNIGVDGANLWTNSDRSRHAPGITSISRVDPMPEAPRWSLDLKKTIFVQNTIISNAIGGAGKPTLDLKGFVYSGGNNLISADEVLQGTLTHAVDATVTTIDINRPLDGLPPVPFSMTVAKPLPTGTNTNNVEDIKYVAEDVWVTAYQIQDDAASGKHTASLTVVRGRNGTTALAHNGNAFFTIDANGLWRTTDRHGSNHVYYANYQTFVNEPNGVSSTRKIIQVEDSSNFPSAPFGARMSFLDGSVLKFEDVLVEAVVGSMVKIRRGGTALNFPDRTQFTFSVPISARLDKELKPVSLLNGEWIHPLQGQSTSIDRGSEYGQSGEQVSLATNLSDNYTSRASVQFALVSQATNWKTVNYLLDLETTIVVDNLSGLPATPFLIRVDDELMQVNSVDSQSKSLSISRGMYGTSVKDHASGRDILVGQSITATASQNVLVVDSVANLPTAPFVLRLGDELLKVVQVSSSANTITVERGAYATQLRAHETGSDASTEMPNLSRVLFAAEITTTVNFSRVDISTRLTTALSAGESSLRIGPLPTFAFESATFPVKQILKIGDEFLRIDAVNVDGSYAVTRGLDGSPVGAYPANQAVTLVDLTIAHIANASQVLPAPFLLRAGDEVMQVSQVQSGSALSSWAIKFNDSQTLLPDTAQVLTLVRGQLGTRKVTHRGAEDAVVGKLIDGVAPVTKLSIWRATNLPEAPFLVTLSDNTFRVTNVDKQYHTLTIEPAGAGSTLPTVNVNPTWGQGTYLELASVGGLTKDSVVRAGDELLRVVSVDTEHKLVVVTRGMQRTQPAAQLVGSTFLFGADEPSSGVQVPVARIPVPVASATATQIVVDRPNSPLPPTFTVRLLNEVMHVTSWTEQLGNRLLLNVARGLRGTQASTHSVGEHMVFQLDQLTNARVVDSNSDGIIASDIGAVETIRFEVNSTADFPDLSPGDGAVNTGTAGQVTLRAAIMEANELGGPAIIVVPAGNYLLQSALDIKSHVVIEGHQVNDTIIRGNGSNRLFVVKPDAILTLSQVSLKDGYASQAGGAIFVDHGQLQTVSTSISSSSAAQGGAIASVGGQIHLDQSSLWNNTVSSNGGAIWAIDSELTISASTISGNTAAGSGGGIFGNDATLMSIQSSTIAYNSASNSAGALRAGSGATLGNVLIANNNAPADTEVGGNPQSAGHNLISQFQQRTTSLAAYAAGSATMITVNNPSIPFPALPFRILVDSEEMTVTAITANQLTVVRGVNGTSADNHQWSATVRYDGFFRPGDSLGTIYSPLDAQLSPLQTSSAAPAYHTSTSPLVIDKGGSNHFVGPTTWLAKNLNSSDRSIVVRDWEHLPAVPFQIRIDSEVTTVIRKDGSYLELDLRPAAQTHTVGSLVTVLVDQNNQPRPTLDVGPPAALVSDYTTGTTTTGGGSDPLLGANGLLGGGPGLGTGPGTGTGLGTGTGTGTGTGSGATNWQLNPPAIDIGAIELVPLLSLVPVSMVVTEGTSSFATTMQFKVMRQGKTTDRTWAEYRIFRQGDLSTDGGDFVGGSSPSGILIFEPNETEKLVTLNINADSIVEANESFRVQLSSYSPGALVTNGSLVGLINNDDQATVTVTSTPMAEGLPVQFTFTINNSVQGGFTIPLATANGTAVAGQDYTALSSKIHFEGKAGEAQLLRVATLADNTVELNETVQLALSALTEIPTSVISSITVLNAAGTILNDDTTSIVVRPLRVIEGDAGTSQAVVEVVLGANGVDAPVSVNVATSSSGQTASSTSDYIPVNTTLNFSGAAGQVLTVSVPIKGDLTNESDESFRVVLSSVSASGRDTSITTVTSTVTIQNDDVPRYVVTSARSLEDNAANNQMLFTVKLVKPSPGAQSVTVTTVNGTATAGVDYVYKSEVLSFQGTAGETKTFSVTINPDAVTELDESFTVSLTNPLIGTMPASGYQLVGGTGEILNDDQAQLSFVQDEQGNEGSTLTFKVQLLGSLDVPFSITAGTRDETAIAGQGYTTTTSTLSFTGAANQTLNFIVPTIDNNLPGQGDTQFGVALSGLNAQGRRVAVRPYALGNIRENDAIYVPPAPAQPRACRPKQVREIMTGASQGSSYVGQWPEEPQARLVPLLEGFRGDPSQVHFNEAGELIGADGHNYGTGWIKDSTGIIFRTAMVQALVTPTNLAIDAEKLRQVGGPGSSQPPSDPPPPAKSGCVDEEEEEDEEEEDSLFSESIHADWVVSYKQPLTFNPFASFNHKLSSEVALAVQANTGSPMISVGQSVHLKFGTLKVNADNTLTYTPDADAPNRAELNNHLIPEYDADGGVVRFTGQDSFAAHLIDASSVSTLASSGEVAGSAIAKASLPIDLMVSNQLPVLRGQRIHDESSESSRLDGPVYADFGTTYRIDLRDLYEDPDADLDRLKIVGISYGQAELDANSEINVKIGAILNVNPNTGFSTVFMERNLKITKINDHIIEIQNEISQSEVQNSSRWRATGYPNQLEFSIKLSDSQNIFVRGADGKGKSKRHDWDFRLPVNVNNSFNTNTMWRNSPGVPDVEFRPWVQVVTPANRAESSTAPRSQNWHLSAQSSVELQNSARENVGGVDVDMIAGTFRTTHPLILDGSGGTSELTPSALVYDSSLIYEADRATPIILARLDRSAGEVMPSGISAKLTWFGKGQDGEGTSVESTMNLTPTSLENSYSFSIRPEEVPHWHGVYGWKLDVELSFANTSETVKLQTAGETPVTVGDQTAIFGAGWIFDNLPWFYLDERNTNEKLDDRFVISFPFEAPVLFDASALTNSDFDFQGELRNVQYGSSVFGSTGFIDPMHYGKVESLADDELVYTSADGVQYVAKRHVIDDESYYFLDRIEPAGVDFNPTSQSPGRRGVAFEWDLETYDFPVLSKLIASDGTENQFDYDAGYLKSIRTVVNGVDERKVNFTINAERELTSIETVNSGPAGLSVTNQKRVMSYEKGVLKKDQWFTAGSQLKLESETNFLFTHPIGLGQTSLQLSGIVVGELAGPGIRQEFEVTPASVMSRTSPQTTALTGKVRQSVDYLKYENGPLPAGGHFETELTLDSHYRLASRRVQFDPSAAGSNVLQSETQWTYDAIGAINEVKERRAETSAGANEFRVTTLWYDYEKPTTYSSSDPGASDDQTGSYDPDDFRGNIIYQMSLSGFDKFEYETDNELEWARGRLVYSERDAKVDGSGKNPEGGPNHTVQSAFEYYMDGRMKSSRVIRGKDDRNVTSGNDDDSDRVESWEYYDGGSFRGYLKSYVDALGQKFEYSQYDGNGRVTETKNHTSYNGVTTETIVTGYDKLGFVNSEKVLSPDQKVLRYTATDFDDFGNALRSSVHSVVPTSPTSSLTMLTSSTREYDGLGRVVREVDGIGTVTERQFALPGLLISETIGVGSTYPNHVTSNIDNLAQTTRYQYYTDGQLGRIILPSEGNQHDVEEFFIDVANRTSWTRKTGLAGESSVANSTLNLVDSRQRVVRSKTDFLGQVIETEDLLTGDLTTYTYADPRVAVPTTVEKSVVKKMNEGTTQRTQAKTIFAYDGQGHVLRTQTDNLPATVTQYDSLGNVREVTVEADLKPQIKFKVNPAGLVVQQTEVRKGGIESQEIVTKYAYDSQGRLRKTVDALAGSEANTQPETAEYGYKDGHSLITATSRTGEVTIQEIDALGNVVQTTNPYGGTTLYEYNQVGDVISSAQGSKRTNVVYDALRRARKATDVSSDVAQTQITYTDYFQKGNALGNTGIGMWSVVTTDPLDRKSAMRMDSEGRVMATVSSENLDSIAYPKSLTVISYANNSAQLTETQKVTRTLSSALSPIPYSVSPTTPETLVTTDILTTSGQVLRSTQQKGNSAEHVVRQNEYDEQGRLVWNSNDSGLITTYAYDDQRAATGKVSEIKADHALPVFRRYDTAGQVTAESSIEDFSGSSVTNWTYDALGRPLSQSILVRDRSGANAVDLPSTRSWEYKGNVVEYVNRNGWKLVTSVDTTQRQRTDEAFAPNSATSFERIVAKYNADGTLQTTSNHDVAGLVSQYDLGYDDLGRTNTLTLQASAIPNKQIEYVYTFDTANRITSRAVKSGQAGALTDLFTTTYVRSEGDKLTQVKESGPGANDKVVALSYRSYGSGAGGSVKSITRHKSLVAEASSQVLASEYSYDNSNVSEIKHTSGTSNTVVRRYAYEYNADGQLTSYEAFNGTGVVIEDSTYQYDERERLVSTTSGETAPSTVAYTLDEGGNRSGSVDPHNRLLDDASGSYRYDQEGNVVYRWKYDNLSREEFNEANNQLVITANKVLIQSKVSEISSGVTYTVRVSDLDIDSDFAPGNIKYYLVLRKDSDNSVLAEKPLTNLNLRQIGKLTDYHYSADDVELTYNSTYTGKVQAQIRFEQGTQATIHIRYKGIIALRGLDSVFYYRWDYQNRLVEAFEDTSPTSASLNWTESDFSNHSWPYHSKYSYDAMNNLLVRNIVSENRKIVYVTEAGHPLLEFDGNANLLRHRLYADSQLVAVDTQAPASTPVPPGGNSTPIIVWPIADRQGSIRDLYWQDTGTDAQNHNEHLLQDEFGAPATGAAPDGTIMGSVNSRFLGLEWFDDIELYMVDNRPYDPVSGRLLNTDLNFELGGANPYVFGNNTPVNRNTTEGAKQFWQHFVDDMASQVESLAPALVRTIGGVQVVGGALEIATGIAACVTVVGCVGGAVLVLHGLDDMQAGVRSMITGEHVDTFTHQLTAAASVKFLGMSKEQAERTASVVDIVSSIGVGALDDGIRTAAKMGSRSMRTILAHSARHAAVEGGITLAAGYAGYQISGGNWDAALGAASAGNVVGGAIARFSVACFTAGTPLVVDLDGNSRPIEEIEVGDSVLARSEFDPNGPLELKRVEEKFIRTSVVMELVVEGRSIKTTIEHPFYLPDQQAFVPAGELKAGDQLISHDGRLIAIHSVNSTGEVATVYNMRVADHHTYFVGGDVWGWDVWVHNAAYAPRAGLRLPDPDGTPGGVWAGARGDSVFSPQGKSIRDRMARIGGRRDIEYKEGYADFTPFAKTQSDGSMYQVSIAYTGNRGTDFTAAKKALMDEYGLTSKEAKKIIRRQTWHHTENVWVDSDGVFRGTMILVDKRIHNTFRHTGGFDIHKSWLETGVITK